MDDKRLTIKTERVAEELSAVPRNSALFGAISSGWTL